MLDPGSNLFVFRFQNNSILVSLFLNMKSESFQIFSLPIRINMTLHDLVLDAYMNFLEKFLILSSGFSNSFNYPFEYF